MRELSKYPHQDGNDDSNNDNHDGGGAGSGDDDNDDDNNDGGRKCSPKMSNNTMRVRPGQGLYYHDDDALLPLKNIIGIW